MGHFRIHKANRYTLEEAVEMERDARKSVLVASVNFNIDNEEYTDALQKWGEARELLARKENENHSEIR